MTTKFGLVGSPISHSFSPVLHNRAYEFLGLDFSFESFDVASYSLGEFLATDSLAGVSVTMPLKREAFGLATQSFGDARLTGVANTLVRHSDEWVGYNTDVFGITKALSDVPQPEHVHILGSGSTAISGVLALSRLYPGTDVAVMARKPEEVSKLVSFGNGFGLSCRALDFEATAIIQSDLVLSFVPSGSLKSLWQDIALSDQLPRGVLFDSSYRPWPSFEASAWRSQSISGIEMLVWQAIAQVRLFAQGQAIEISIDEEVLYREMLASVRDR